MAKENNYPSIPTDKRCFTIGEAARLSLSKPHILRYWEKEVPALSRQISRRGNRRYYSREAVATLRRIHLLVSEKSYTIAGARRALQGGESREDVARFMNLRRGLEQVIKIL